MKLFLDTNVVIDYIAAREPFCHDIRRIILGSKEHGIQLTTSSITFTTMEYVLKRQVPHDLLMRQFALLRQIIDVPPTDANAIDNSIASTFQDFEDAVQHYTALGQADIIITRNPKDFLAHSQLLVLTPSEFLAQYFSWGEESNKDS